MTRQEKIAALIKCEALLTFAQWFALVGSAFTLKAVQTLTPETAYADYVEETLTAFEATFN